MSEAYDFFLAESLRLIPNEEMTPFVELRARQWTAAEGEALAEGVEWSWSMGHDPKYGKTHRLVGKRGWRKIAEQTFPVQAEIICTDSDRRVAEAHAAFKAGYGRRGFA